MNNKICKYCLNLGIELPHNHTIRNFSLPTKPLICPKLLANKCSYCHEIGHTKNYCNVLNKKRQKQTANNRIVLINDKKRDLDFDTENELSSDSDNEIDNNNSCQHRKRLKIE